MRRTLSVTHHIRGVIDYGLQRRALLRDVRRGYVGTHEACDASPYLLRAAQFFGEQTEIQCPICRRESLWHVHFVYGDALAGAAGQARNAMELPELARRYGECEVYLVEVCQGCLWNHLVEKFTIVDDGPTRDGQSRMLER